MSGNKKSEATKKAKYGEDFHARIGAKGGRAKVKKGMAVILERMTPAEREEFFRKRNEKRWGKKNGN